MSSSSSASSASPSHSSDSLIGATVGGTLFSFSTVAASGFGGSESFAAAAFCGLGFAVSITTDSVETGLVSVGVVDLTGVLLLVVPVFLLVSAAGSVTGDVVSLFRLFVIWLSCLSETILD